MRRIPLHQYRGRLDRAHLKRRCCRLVLAVVVIRCVFYLLT